MRRLRDPMTPLKKAFNRDLSAIRNPYYQKVTEEGKSAAWDGLSAEENPYPSGSEYGRWWSEAFNNTREEIKRSRF